MNFPKLNLMRFMQTALPLAVTAAMALPVNADVIGGEVAVSYWNGSYGGGVSDRSVGAQEVTLDNDLKFDDSGFVEFSAALEHPIPVLPNVRIRHIGLDETANGQLNASFENVPVSADVKTELDLTHTTVALYYEVLDNVVSLDIGLEAKLFDGNLRIEEQGGTNQVSETKIDDPIPLAYVSADVDLPFTGLTIGAEVSAISYSGDKIMDARAAIRYNVGLLFVEGGYRTMQIKVEDVNDIDVDADLSGAFVSAGIDF